MNYARKYYLSDHVGDVFQSGALSHPNFILGQFLLIWEPGIKSAGLYGSCTKKWRCFHMENPNLLLYETIVRATSGEPEAVDEALRHYSKRIRIAAIENGHIDKDTEDSIKSRLVTALFKFRFDEHDV